MRLSSSFRQLFFALACIVAGCGEDTVTPTVDAEPSLLGTWRVAEKKLADIGVEIRWTFSADEIVVSDGAGEVISRSVYHIDTSRDPHHITMEIGDIVAEIRPGIFDIDGDSARLCFTVDGSARPENFTGGQLMTLERVAGPEL